MLTRVFKLTRYFSLLSLIVVVLAGGLLATLVRQQQVDHLESLAADRNATMTRLFQNLLWQDIEPLLISPQANSADSAQITRLNTKLKVWLRESDVAKIKVYNLSGVTVFSTERSQVGEDKSSNSGYQSARRGSLVSELVHRGKFSASEGDIHDVDLVSSYVPVSINGRVVAVFELYQNVTTQLDDINRTAATTTILIAAILLALYLVQLLVVRRAQSVISAQEARLENINQELDQRVENRTAELRQSEARINELLTEQRIIFDNAHVGILVLKERRILRSNQRIAELFGFTRPEEYEASSTEIFYASHEDFIAAGNVGYRQLKEHGVAHFETEMRRKDGTPIWIMQSGRPLDAASVLDGVSIWVYTDVTELKRSETESRIAAAAFESQQGMLVTDAKGIVLRINRKFTEMSGFLADDIVGKNPRVLQSGQHDGAFFAAMWSEIRDKGSWQGEILDKRKNGEIFPNWVTISVVKNKDDEVTHYVAAYVDITERKAAEEKINQLAFYDQLTGLPNRTLVLDRLQHVWRKSQRTGQYAAILIIDLDQFAALNDTKGHAYGDILLQSAAARLSRDVPQADTIARHGGDEFVMLLSTNETDLDAAIVSIESDCERILALLKQPHQLPDIDYICTASIGVTCFNGRISSADDLMRQADLAMYRSKKAGGNCFTFFDKAMETAALEHMRLSADMRHGIEDRQFEVYYQAQVDGKQTHIVGAEALIRWNHPSRGRVSPAEFIPHAEQSGLIVPLGKWILEDVCSQLARWSGMPEFASLVMAVNVSAHQLREADFVEMVIAILERSGAKPQRLKLELTESVFAGDADQIVTKMSSLKAIGIGFSIDDFGTGYSSLSYLSRMPLDQLKIDQSFVADLETNESHVSICAATISLAHSLKLKVVAEGVETEAQRYFLGTVHQCDLLQGYLFSKPLPLAEFEALCRR
jgi:diguanylate cyclase (GGDEF)-like protein/PAS domain S-box-containing protein